MPFSRRLVRLACLAAGILIGSASAGCLTPEEAALLDALDAAPEAADRAPADARVRTVQLYRTGDEASLPILVLTPGETLTLAFDLLDAGTGRPLSVEFVHTDRQGRADLLPTEFLTGLDRDDLLGFRVSGNTAVSYVHYRYSFPNQTIGFRLSGAYRLRVTEPGSTQALLEVPFWVTEQSAEAEVFFGTGLADGAGIALQPAARVRPGPRLSGFEAFQFTACFARNGRLERLRCAPEPGLVGLALFQFLLPRSEAFAPPPPLFTFDLGRLSVGPDVDEADLAARPPAVRLRVDGGLFARDLREDDLAGRVRVRSVFADGGQGDTDAEYADVTFRYAPPDGRPSAGPMFVYGPFTGWQFRPEGLMTWRPDVQRYEATLRLKQGRYSYAFAAPEDPPRRRAVAIGQPTLFTTLVFLADPQRGTDRLVAVQNAIAR